jgi:hypothetical protein
VGEPVRAKKTFDSIRHVFLILVVSIGILSCSVSLAHQDRILSIAADGSIPQLPPEYAATRLTIAFPSNKINRASPTVSFATAKGATTLPLCATQLIESRSIKSAVVLGSWYHDLKSMPPYIYLKFLSPQANELSSSSYRSSVDFLFDLRTAELRHIEKNIASADGKSLQTKRFTISDVCGEHAKR